MLTRRSFTLLAATLPLGLINRRNASAQTLQAPPLLSLEEENQRQAEWSKAHYLPVALVHAEGEKRLYSSAVNSITCWADVGPVTWLGTRLGVKRVSKELDSSPRHYMRADGLPGERVSAIVADERGAYALIDLGEEEALCAFEPEKDCWETLARWQKGPWEYGDQPDGSLVLGRDVVLAAPRLLETKTAVPLHCFDRARNEPRTLPWDVGVRADNSALLITFLSCREKTVLLGTNIGLIELPLSGDSTPWTRRLVDKGIVHGVEGSGRFYLWLAPRAMALSLHRSSMSSFAYSSVSTQQAELNLYELASGKLQPLPEKPQLAISETVVGDDGALWLIDKTDYDKSRWRPIHWPPYLLARWKPGDAAWTSFYPDGTVASETLGQQSLIPQLYTLLPIPSAEIIPEKPARFVASNAPIGRVPYAYSATESSAARYPAAARWLKERFPHWVSPEDSSVLSKTGLFDYPMRQAVYPDPKESDRFWVTKGQGVLASVAAGSKEAQILPASAESYLVGAAGVSSFRIVPNSVPGQVALPPKPLELHAKIRNLVALGDGTYIATGAYAFHISQGGRSWREIQMPTDRYNHEESLSHSDFFFPAGRGKALLSTAFEKTLRQPDLAAGKLIPTQIPIPRNGTFIGTDSTGAWWHTGGNKYQFLAAGSTKVQVRGADKPAGITLYDQPVLRAGRLWWHGNDGRGSLIIGWDPVQDKWTVPLSVNIYSGKVRPVVDKQGRVLIAGLSGNQKEVTIHGWQPKKNLWESMGTMPWASDGQPTLIRADKEGIWLTDQKSLLRFDPAKKTFQQEPLPESGDREMQLWEEGGEIFLIARERLWQFDRRQNTWREWKVPVLASQLWPQIAATDGAALWGFLNARNAAPPPVFQFEPATRTFSFFQESAGLPGTPGGKMTEVGGQIWLLHPTGAFRFDNASQRFINEAPFPAGQVAAAQSKAYVWISGEPAQKDGPTLYRWNAASGKTVPDSNSVQNRCQALLSSGEGVLVATKKGLYKIDAQSVWTPVDTLQMPVGQLMRDAAGTVWATTAGPGYLRLSAKL